MTTLKPNSRRGRWLLVSRQAGRISPASWTIGALLLLMAAVVAIALLPEDDGSTARKTPATSPPESEPQPKRWKGTTEEEGATVSSITPRSDQPQADIPSSTEVRVQAQGSVAIIELLKEDDEPLRDIHGVVVSREGTVLCRFQPLLGAHRGTCRLPGSRESRVEIRGVSYHDGARDLALLRVASGGANLRPLPLLEEDPTRLFLTGDEIYVFSGYRLNTAVVARPRAWIASGAEGLALAADPPVAPETLLALDAYGVLVGLCRPTVDGVPVSGNERLRDEEKYEVVVDPVDSLQRRLDQPVARTLYQLTLEFYQGTFADLSERGLRAYRQESWEEAVELLAAAVDRAPVEGIPPERLDRVASLLRESYLRDVQRLQSSQRYAEAAQLTEAALARFPEDAVLWAALARARESQGMLRESIDALLQLRQIQPGDAIDKGLQEAYLKLAAEGLSRGDSRFGEAALLEGIEQLPRSGRLHFELGKLYQQWEAYDDAIRQLQTAGQLDRSLSDQVASALDRIDDVLKRRDAVIVPIAPGSSLIRAQVVVDGRWERQFVIDTGATHTTLSWEMAREMGYDPEQGGIVRLDTAGVTTIGRRIQVGSVSLGGYTVRNLDVIILPASSPIRTGLLGQNFLRHFKYSVDTRRGEFRLERP